MIRNYLKIAIRNLLKNRLNSLTNIIGLAVGLSVCLLMLLYVFHELSFEKEIKDADRKYQVYRYLRSGQAIAKNSPNLAKELKAQMPEVKDATEFMPFEFSLIKDGKLNRTLSIIAADVHFLNFFSIPLLKGNPANVLNEPNTAVLSEELAKSLWKDEDPTGKTIMLKTDDGNKNFKVTGVSFQVPGNSQIKFDAIISDNILDHMNYTTSVCWNTMGPLCFIMLENNSYACVEEKLPGFVERNAGGDNKLGLLPLTDIHLKSNLNSQLKGSSNIKYIYIFVSLAVLLLLISNVNFISLTAANYVKRIREVGIRKTIGADKKNLFFQFLVENMIIVFISLFVAYFLSEILLNFLNDLLETNITLNLKGNSSAFLFTFLLTVTIAVISTIYVSRLVAKQNSTDLIGGRTININTKSAARKILIAGQFAIAIFLLCGTLIMWNQISFVKHKDLGFNREQVIVVPSFRIFDKAGSFIDELKKYSGINNVSYSTWFPGGSSLAWTYKNDDGEMTTFNLINVDENYFPLMDIKIKEGRNFNKDFSESNNLLINRKTAEMLELKDPLNQYVKLPGLEGRVIGIINDIHFQSLKESMEPLIFQYKKDYWGFIGIKVKPGRIKETLEYIQKKWTEFVPFDALEFSFVDETLNEQYADDNRLFKASVFISILAFFISLLGIFAITAFVVENRIKEIGIRKVLGASVPGIVHLLSKDFMKWVMLANIIAWPAAYYFMNKWLADFAFRIDISLWMLALPGGVALIIALVTVSFQAVKAATANPVESLKYE